jgi:hypothetical protein
MPQARDVAGFPALFHAKKLSFFLITADKSVIPEIKRDVWLIIR